MKPKNADDLEEWTRIRNMERRREIQSLKQQNLDLKKELDVVQVSDFFYLQRNVFVFKIHLGFISLIYKVAF